MPAPVTLTPDELRSVQLGVLLELVAWCRRHEVTCYLAYGTLLGAVRHGGFVPWDDDVDVMVPRADYDRLVAALGAPGDDAPPWLALAATERRDDWPLPYAKVCDRRTDVAEALHDPVPMGVNVDVFPVDDVPAGALRRWWQRTRLRSVRWALELHYVHPTRGHRWHGPVAMGVVKPLVRLLPVRVLVRTLDRLARSGSRHASGQVGVRVGSFDWSVPRALLGEPVPVDFAGHRLSAPADADAVLTVLYGDWRTPPPAAEQVTHHSFTATRVPPSSVG